MSIVKILDDNTINKIAAGEVVERPASVIKELVENSIDASATRIEIEILAGGTNFIRVTDNGIGMDEEDAKMALLRHATSKIKNIADIIGINTLGFRGEAIPSIASVSHFSILTRSKEKEIGTYISIDGGKNMYSEEAGSSIGTTIKVKDLFFNTPARKKFLKTTNTEGNKISEVLIKLALTNPNIIFHFINNNKTVMSTPGNSSLKDTINSIYGQELTDALLDISFVDTDISIHGYITKPSVIRSNRNWQTFIVNGRVVSNKAIVKSIDNAYHSLLPKSGYPFVILNIIVPPESIDVNAHPQKLEIKFEDEGKIFKSVYKAILSTINSIDNNLNHIATHTEKINRHISMLDESSSLFQPHLILKDNPSYFDISTKIQQPKSNNNIDDRVEVQPLIQTEHLLNNTSYNIPSQKTEKIAENIPSVYNEQINMIPIGQVSKCYILATDKDTLYIIDQHAAHERILYDRLCSNANNIPSQQLLIHLILKVSALEAEQIEKYHDLFVSLGFTLTACDKNEFRLSSIPMDIDDSQAEDIIREILIAIFNSHEITPSQIRHTCLATTACRAAIKAGDELTLKQMQIIIDDLASTSRPYTCPHGRPTILKFTTSELGKMFKRT